MSLFISIRGGRTGISTLVNALAMLSLGSLERDSPLGEKTFAPIMVLYYL